MIINKIKCITTLIIISIFFHNEIRNEKKYLIKNRVCIINLHNSINVGNILVKFSLFTKIKEFGLKPLLIIPKLLHELNNSFLTKTTNFTLIKENFSELKENDYDYVILNSDQTWGYYNRKYFYDIAFLKFAYNWKIPKFIYATSIGQDYWFFNKEEEEQGKKLLKNFTGISFREKGLIKLAEEHLGIKGKFVLDPTLLIDKKYYLNQIKEYKTDFTSNDKFIFVYQLDKNLIFEKVINDSHTKFNFKINKLQLFKDDFVERFIFGISNCQAVLTDSFHGTIFSIMFNKPFIAFINNNRGKGRFDNLKEIFNLNRNIIDTRINKSPDINILLEPLKINQTLFSELKNFSVNYLKKHLNIE